jgi:hypothetical protein
MAKVKVRCPLVAPTPPKFVTVLVEEHEELPEGCCMRFKLVDEPRAVRLVRHEADGGPTGAVWRVESREEDGSAGVAWAATVEDSGAGTCMLLFGGARGLRLRPVDGGEIIAEPYLLLSRECFVE